MAGLFRKNIEKRCAYCARGTTISDCEVACSKKGVVDSTYHCWHFRYDPLRRVPPRPAGLSTNAHKPEDFSIE